MRLILTGGVVPLLLMCSLAVPARASLVFQGLVTGGGAGIGTSNIILTIQNTGTESGCVGWNGTVDVIGSAACPTTSVPGGAPISPAIAGGNEKTGSSQTQTRTVGSLALTTAGLINVIFNANEPGGDSITVNNLVLTIYSPTGTVLFSSGNLFGGPVTIANSETGQGNLGFAFRLDTAQAALAQPYISCPGCGLNRIGIAGVFSNAAGSNETLSIVELVPEPVTIYTFGSGLLALALYRRYRRS